MDCLECTWNFFRIGAPTFQARGVPEDDGENVIEIVRNSACQRSKAFHSLRLHKLLFKTLAFRVI